MSEIYHITTAADWELALKNGFYASASLADEGFIHCSQEEQIAGVLQRYYAGRLGLVKLVIDPEKLESRLIYEWSPSTQDTFPHIYGPINLGAVTGIQQITNTKPGD
ncbi:MAG: DUF952 domain-containing protein [Chitinophagaceae bacterium]|nr:MAG: DUF952 domain-containing protein [Chitinophagaceae bacterium]